MATDTINDFLLDQELESDPLAGDNDLPDDIDAILDAVEEEDLNLSEPSVELPEDLAFSDDLDILDQLKGEESLLTEPDLDRELNMKREANPDAMDIPIDFANEPIDHGDNIPLISDIIDPNAPSHSAELDDSLSFDLMAKIQSVVEQAINKEVGRIANTLRDNVLDEVKNQLPAVISKVLKSRK